MLFFLCSTVNWTVPFLSWLAITALCSATVLLYLIPLRYLVLVWGESCFYSNSWPHRMCIFTPKWFLFFSPTQVWISSPRSSAIRTWLTTTSFLTFSPECRLMFKWWVREESTTSGNTEICIETREWIKFFPLLFGFPWQMEKTYPFFPPNKQDEA